MKYTLLLPLLSNILHTNTQAGNGASSSMECNLAPETNHDNSQPLTRASSFSDVATQAGKLNNSNNDFDSKADYMNTKTQTDNKFSISYTQSNDNVELKTSIVKSSLKLRINNSFNKNTTPNSTKKFLDFLITLSSAQLKITLMPALGKIFNTNEIVLIQENKITKEQKYIYATRPLQIIGRKSEVIQSKTLPEYTIHTIYVRYIAAFSKEQTQFWYNTQVQS